MLTHVEIKGYKSLKDVSLDMNGLTVLIGPNGSGKSNFLDVFALMPEAAHGRLSSGIVRRGNMDACLFKGATGGFLFQFDFDTLEQEKVGVRYELQIEEVFAGFSGVYREVVLVRSTSSNSSFAPRVQANLANDDVLFYDAPSYTNATRKNLETDDELVIFQVKDRTTYPTPYELLRELQGWTCYTPLDVGPQSLLRLPQTIQQGMDLLPDGSNLFSVLQNIQNKSPGIWGEVCEILANFYEGFRDMTFPNEGGDGKILLRWWEHPFEKKYNFSVNLLSDGTLRLLVLLAILKTPTPPPLICIEEPELGLHPDWIKLVAELLEEAATRTQIIVTTHSPTLVSHVQPKHVVVVEKEDGATYLERLSAEKLSAWLEEFQLGDLWLAGHLGGRP